MQSADNLISVSVSNSGRVHLLRSSCGVKAPVPSNPRIYLRSVRGLVNFEYFLADLLIIAILKQYILTRLFELMNSPNLSCFFKACLLLATAGVGKSEVDARELQFAAPPQPPLLQLFADRKKSSPLSLSLSHVTPPINESQGWQNESREARKRLGASPFVNFEVMHNFKVLMGMTTTQIRANAGRRLI